MARKLAPEIQAIVSASDAGLHLTTAILVEDYLAQDPDNVRARLDLGHALAQLGRHTEAERAYQDAIERSDGGPVDVIYGELGHLYRAQGDLESARQWYRKQMDSDPEDARGCLFLAHLEKGAGRLDEAVEILRQGQQRQTGVDEAYHLALAQTYAGLGHYGDARQHLMTALEIAPGWEPARTALKDVKFALARQA